MPLVGQIALDQERWPTAGMTADLDLALRPSRDEPEVVVIGGILHGEPLDAHGGQASLNRANTLSTDDTVSLSATRRVCHVHQGGNVPKAAPPARGCSLAKAVSWPS